MTYVYWGIIMGLIFTCVRFALTSHQQHLTINGLKSSLKFLREDRDKIFSEYSDLKDRIQARAGVAKVVTSIPKRYSGAQLRIMNDRLNAKQAGEVEIPNSEVLKEQANG